jgi:hypothetical protein
MKTIIRSKQLARNKNLLLMQNTVNQLFKMEQKMVT